MRKKPHPRMRALALPVCALAIAVTVGACGSSSATTTSSAASAGTGSTSARFQARLNLAKCMRAHGINVPDPTAGGGPAQGGSFFRVFRDYPSSQIRAAFSACRQYAAAAFPGFNETPAQRAARTAQLVKFAQCMRSHGVNIPDPTTNGGGPGGGGFAFGAQGSQSFRSQLGTPAFKAASTACASLRPRFGRGGGGGFAGPPPGAGATGSSTGGGTAGA
jgi:hypothetical protein